MTSRDPFVVVHDFVADGGGVTVAGVDDGVTGQLGLSDNIAANLHVVHEDTFANLPNTRIRNTQAVLGVLLSY